MCALSRSESKVKFNYVVSNPRKQILKTIPVFKERAASVLEPSSPNVTVLKGGGIMFPRKVDIYEAIPDHVADGLVDLPHGLSFDTYQQNICSKIFIGMSVMHTPSIPTPTDSFNHSNNLRGRPRIMKFFTITFSPQPQYTTGFLVGKP